MFILQLKKQRGSEEEQICLLPVLGGVAPDCLVSCLPGREFPLCSPRQRGSCPALRQSIRTWERELWEVGQPKKARTQVSVAHAGHAGHHWEAGESAVTSSWAGGWARQATSEREGLLLGQQAISSLAHRQLPQPLRHTGLF